MRVKADVKFEGALGEQPLQKFQDIISDRMRYLHETVEDSLAACAIQVLRSVRSSTKVAKIKAKVVVKRDPSLKPSYRRVGGKNRPCLRVGSDSGPRYVAKPNEKVKFTDASLNSKVSSAYRFQRPNSDREYVIVANDAASAKAYAQNVMAKVIGRFRGLARTAIGSLMKKACTIRLTGEDFGTKVRQKADQTTRKAESAVKTGKDRGIYTLELSDELKYAALALRHGRADIDTAAMKAANKIASIINRKVGPNFLDGGRIATPFPEVVKRRKR